MSIPITLLSLLHWYPYRRVDSPQIRGGCGFSPDPGEMWGGGYTRLHGVLQRRSWGTHQSPYSKLTRLCPSTLRLTDPPLAAVEGKTDRGFPPLVSAILMVSIPHQSTDIKGEIPDLSCLLLSNRLYGEFASWL